MPKMKYVRAVALAVCVCVCVCVCFCATNLCIIFRGITQFQLKSPNICYNRPQKLCFWLQQLILEMAIDVVTFNM